MVTSNTFFVIGLIMFIYLTIYQKNRLVGGIFFLAISIALYLLDYIEKGFIFIFFFTVLLILVYDLFYKDKEHDKVFTRNQN